MKFRKCLLKVGDTIKVITGKDKNIVSKIIAFDRKSGKIKVEGCRMQTHYPNKNEASSEKSIVQKEGYMDISNVMILNSAGVVTRLKRIDGQRAAVKGSLNTGDTNVSKK